MRYGIVAMLFALVGCTNAPIAGFLDKVFPAPGGEGGRLPPPPPPDRAPPGVPEARPSVAGPDALPPAADTIPSVAPR